VSKVIIGAPGKDLKSFISHISFDLKRRRVEYLVVGFFNDNGQPIGMIENKGKASWVECNSNHIIETARKLKATGVCLLHNHPRSVREAPNLKPSDEDISFLKDFIPALDGTGLTYLGNWISSNGHLTEILYSLQAKNELKNIDNQFSDAVIASLLTPELKFNIQQLTKTLLLQVNWYRITEKYFKGSKVEFIVKSLKYFGDDEEEWMFCMTSEDTNNIRSGVALNVEQAIKAYDAIVELQNVSNKLKAIDIEYTEVTVDIADNAKCGFYQTGTEQGAFWNMGNNQIFLKVSDLTCISDFVAVGLEKVDSIISQTQNSVSQN
jgi:hypothetical protein